MPEVILVDDDVDILNLLEIILTEAGYTVWCVESGQELFLELEKHKPDTIVLDLNLPDISGDIIIDLLNQNQSTQNIPVLLISSRSDLPEIASQSQAYDFLHKPFDTHELLTKLSHATS